ncbi:MAG: adenylate/guanylate cyclase domain-containing protein [bacterium]
MQDDARDSSATIRQRLIRALGIGILSALLATILWQVRALDRLEYRMWDFEVGKFAKPAPTTSQIRLIFLDQDSLDWGKKMGWEWPWPREVYAPVLDFCRRGGVRAIAFDVIFSEPSERIDQDAALGEAIAKTPGFVGTVFVGNNTGSATNWPPMIPGSGIRFKDRYPPQNNPFKMSRAMFPIPEVSTNSTILGTVFGNPDSDGIYRRLRPFSLFDGQVVPSLGLGTFLAATTNRSVMLRESWFGINHRHIRMQLDRNGEAILRYRGKSMTHQTVNISGVIESELLMREGKPPLIAPSSFKDAYVFLGFTAPGLKDLRPSPIDSTYTGVEVHATFLDNLLAGDFMRDAPPWFSILLAFLLACCGAVAIRLGRHIWQNILVFILLLPLPCLLGFLAYAAGFWLHSIFLLTAVIPAVIGALILNYATEGKQKRFIKGAFKQYLSPLVIEELVQHPERLKLGGELRELSIFFSDVRGFTSISERLSPQDLTALLNDYLTAMTDIIYAHGGTVDKYEGDAIIAFWNAPLAQPDHALLAVHTALECQTKLDAMNPEFKERIGAELHQRIGLNSGPVVVGNMGSRQRFNYTFLGDAGNLAARLEGINKQFGTSLLISENTKNQLNADIAVREIARVQVVGRKEPVTVFEPLMLAVAVARGDILATFAKALILYYDGRLNEALALFSTIEAQDAPAAAYAKRCRGLLTTTQEKWTGVWIMTEK